ncbi:MAG: patatin-like phospholipase family protein [Mycobacteriales bacterium]
MSTEDDGQIAHETYLPDEPAGRHGIALCLSGGGYRSALFHLGVLRRLDELGTLTRVDTVSAVSGGSLLAAFLADLAPVWPADGRLPEFDSKVAPALRSFTKKNIRTMWVLRRAAPWNWGDSTVAVEGLVRRYEDITSLHLAELPANPRYIFSATDLSWGVNWVSERARVGSYPAGYVQSSEWSVARAVAASSCFPPAFEPMPVNLAPEQFHGGHERRERRAALIAKLRLADGGLYDNLGLEPVWKDHSVLLVSDGGATFDAAAVEGTFKTVGRYLAVQSRQASALRKRWLIAGFKKEVMRGVYLGIGSTTTSFAVGAPGYSDDLVDEIISEVRTDLDFFSDAEAEVLQNHGYMLADVAMRSHGQAWIDSGVPPLNVPFPTWLDEGLVRSALVDSAKKRTLGRWRSVELVKDKLGALRKLLS